MCFCEAQYGLLIESCGSWFHVHPTFHTSSMCFCEAQYGLLIESCAAAAGFILTAMLSSVHQCSLACDKMSSGVQA